MKKLLPIFFLLLSITIFAQKPIIEMDKLTHDFGNYTPIYYPPATFSFTNTGTAPLAILTVQAAYEVKVMYERGYIFPGETGIITVDYQSQQSGPFQEQIQIYTNADTIPFFLEIKGTNISANECYPDKKNREMRKVITINAHTKQPIPETEVFFYFQQQQEIKAVTEKNGEVVMTLPIGIYDIQAQHLDYLTLQKNMFIPKTKPIIVLELEPKDELEEMLDTIESKPIAIRMPTTVPRTQEPSYPFAGAPEPSPVNTALPGELSTVEYKPNNIVFLIDISYSMKQNKRLTKLKSSLNQAFIALRDIDTISVIAYNHDAYILLEKTTGAEKELLIKTIDTLKPIGLTDGVRGLETAYNLTQSGYIFEGNNQIILATDGEFSGSQQSEPEIMKLVRDNANHGIFISIISFGNDKEALSRLRKIARIGKGSYIHIENTHDTPGIILEEIKGRSKIIL